MRTVIYLESNENLKSYTQSQHTFVICLQTIVTYIVSGTLDIMMILSKLYKLYLKIVLLNIYSKIVFEHPPIQYIETLKKYSRIGPKFRAKIQIPDT